MIIKDYYNNYNYILVLLSFDIHIFGTYSVIVSSDQSTFANADNYKIKNTNPHLTSSSKQIGLDHSTFTVVSNFSAW